MLSVSQIQSVSREHGLELLAVLGAERAQERLRREAPRLASWQAAGYAGEMDYLKRPPELFTDLNNFIEGPAAVLVFAVPYASGVQARDIARPPGFGRVARYAWGRDYHLVIKERLTALARQLQRAAPVPCKMRPFTDAVPLLERSLAQEAGLGFIGKHSLLISSGVGSYLFIAELLVGVSIQFDLGLPYRGSRASWFRALPPEDASRPGSACGSCSKCHAACPTDAFVSSGIVDARHCISYLTIEKRSPFNQWEAQAIGDWVFGCDLCQEVCPFNVGAGNAVVLEDFEERRGAGRLLNLIELLGIRTHNLFKRRFKDSPLLRPGRGALLRNACAVMANTGFEEGASALIAAAQEDPEQLVRGQALQALKQLRPKLSGAVLRQAAALIERMSAVEGL